MTIVVPNALAEFYNERRHTSRMIDHLCRGLVALSLALIVPAAHGGFVKQWSIEELAQASVLSVCRVKHVTVGPRQPQQLNEKNPVHTCTVDLAVLRSLGQVPSRIQMRYDCYPPGHFGGQGYPEFPLLNPGEILVFPFNRTGTTWALIGTDGRGLVMPALSIEPVGQRPATPRAFLIAELTNNFLQGTYPQMFRAGQYLTTQVSSELPKQLLATLKAQIPYGDPRWLDIATAVLATTGIPRLPLDTLIASPPPAAFAPLALSQIPEGHRQQGIVRNMLKYSNVHGWGSAATLVPEFKDDPLLLKLLPYYLERLHSGALNIAWWLARNGQPALLSTSITAAMRILARPTVTHVNDIYAASNLAVDYGSDEQFEQFLAALRKAKLGDSKRYMELWQVAMPNNGARIFKIIAILLDDERPLSPSTSMRYCDIAGGRLQMLSRQDFGFKNWDQGMAERKAAVARARAWLQSRV